MDYTFFFKPEHENGIFSNWFAQEMESPALPGIRFATLEKWMMYQKALTFQDYDVAKRILESHGPAQDKRLGQAVSGFSDDVWRIAMPKIVCAGIDIKFSIQKMRQALMDTRHTILVEASPYDRNYGIKMDRSHRHASSPEHWQGSNLLGFYTTDHRIHLSQTVPGLEPEDPDFVKEYQEIRRSVLARLPVLGKAIPASADVQPLRSAPPRPVAAVRKVLPLRKLSKPPISTLSPLD